jgi:hypothetical protein
VRFVGRKRVKILRTGPAGPKRAGIAINIGGDEQINDDEPEPEEKQSGTDDESRLNWG